jgi:thiosulfate/3-mercaptopyruvate sulfurtransferase
MRIRPEVLLAAGLLGTGSAALPAQRTDVLVSTDWLAQHLLDARLVVIHTSSQRSDFDAGHIPGARWLAAASFTTPRDGLSTELPDIAQMDSLLEGIGISDNSRIVISGGPITATARLYFTLDYFGLGDRVSLLDGGIDAWREQGRPLERIAQPVSRGSVTLRPQASKLVDAKWIVSNAAPGNRVQVLDARTPDFFTGLARNNTPRAGRLPGANNVPFTWLTGELTKYRDRPKLERLFSQAGVKPGDTIVAYCHIGLQASVLYLAARSLGYEAALYDGSFEDWSKRSELPLGEPIGAKPPQK